MWVSLLPDRWRDGRRKYVNLDQITEQLVTQESEYLKYRAQIMASIVMTEGEEVTKWVAVESQGGDMQVNLHSL